MNEETFEDMKSVLKIFRYKLDSELKCKECYESVTGFARKCKICDLMFHQACMGKRFRKEVGRCFICDSQRIKSLTGYRLQRLIGKLIEFIENTSIQTAVNCRQMEKRRKSESLYEFLKKVSICCDHQKAKDELELVLDTVEGYYKVNNLL